MKLELLVNVKDDWTMEITTNQCLKGVNLQKWVLDYVQKNAEVVKNFSSLMLKLSPKMGIKVAQPTMKELPNDRTETYVKMIRVSVDSNVQLVCVIMPTPRDDRYAAVKKLCCVEKPVASQVINLNTIQWIIWLGVDVYHDPSRRSQSIAGIVSSTNASMSRWYSSTCFQACHQELIDALKPAFVKAIKQFYQINHQWPAQILVFRDGVGDSQLSILAKYEAEQFRDTTVRHTPGAMPTRWRDKGRKAPHRDEELGAGKAPEETPSTWLHKLEIPVDPKGEPRGRLDQSPHNKPSGRETHASVPPVRQAWRVQAQAWETVTKTWSHSAPTGKEDKHSTTFTS